MLDECAIGKHLLKLFLSDKVVVLPISLSRTWRAGGVWIKRLGYENSEKIGSDSLRETLNPNLDGWFAKSLVSRVDFPTPDGPDSTRGLRKSEAMVVEDIVKGATERVTGV